MTTPIIITKRTRRETIIKVLREIFKEVKTEKRPSQTFLYLLNEIKQIQKYQNDKEIKEIEKQFLEWFKNQKKGNKNV